MKSRGRSVALLPGAGMERGNENMIDESYNTVKSDFIMALRIIYREGLSDAFAHLSLSSNEANEMMFMPRKSPAIVKSEELFFVDFEKPVSQSSLHRAIYKARP